MKRRKKPEYANVAKAITGGAALLATFAFAESTVAAWIITGLWIGVIHVHFRYPDTDVTFGNRWYLKWCDWRENKSGRDAR